MTEVERIVDLCERVSREVSAEELDALNHWIYCHHCERHESMRLEGLTFVPAQGVCNVWVCPCGGKIHLQRVVGI